MKKQLVIASALLSLASLMGGIVQALPQFGAPGNSKGVQKNAKAATWSVIAAQLKKMFDAKPVGAYASGLSAAGPILTKYYYITKHKRSR